MPPNKKSRPTVASTAKKKSPTVASTTKKSPTVASATKKSPPVASNIKKNQPVASKPKSPSTIPPVASKSNQLTNYWQKKAAPVISILGLDPKAATYCRLLGLFKSGTILLPPIQEEKELAQKLIDRAAALKDDDFTLAAEIQEYIKELKLSTTAAHNNVEEAKNALKESLMAYEYYKKAEQYVLAGQWHAIATAGYGVLAEYFVIELANGKQLASQRQAGTKLPEQQEQQDDMEDDSEDDTEDDVEDDTEAAVGGAPANPHPFTPAEKSVASRKRKVKISTATGERGDHYAGKQAMDACQVFDPFFLAACQSESAKLLVNQLKGFKRAEFSDEFLTNLKKEIPAAIKHSQMVFDWNEIQGSDQYIRRVTRRRLRERRRTFLNSQSQSQENENENDNNATNAVQIDTFINLDCSRPQGRETSYDDWKDDPGERARRIWLWWTPRLETYQSTFKHFAIVLRIIVLNQVSSAGVERVFSQLNYIVRVCGSSMLEDTAAMRLMLRCNEGMVDNYEEH
jgi:hypothetical protein